MKLNVRQICTREVLIDTGVSTVILKEDYVRVALRVEGNVFGDEIV